MLKTLFSLTMLFSIISCQSTSTEPVMPSVEKSTAAQLLRLGYASEINNETREYFVYLPKGFDKNDTTKKWPVMLFLHGNGERGNGLDELDYVISHGPLYEAWIQKRDLPFIIISPQLHMFSMDKKGIGYIDNRTTAQIPVRQENGVPAKEAQWGSKNRMSGSVENLNLPQLPPDGWERVENDLLAMVNNVVSKYSGDTQRTYLTGLSYGGFGTWVIASKNPEKFAAIAPVVGWGHPKFMPSIAKHKIPTWAFAGGRDNVIKAEYFYSGINELEALGHKVLFTTHEDTAHDTWKRVYGGGDLYDWLLKHELAQ